MNKKAEEVKVAARTKKHRIQKHNTEKYLFSQNKRFFLHSGKKKCIKFEKKIPMHSSTF